MNGPFELGYAFIRYSVTTVTCDTWESITIAPLNDHDNELCLTEAFRGCNLSQSRSTRYRYVKSLILG